LAAINPLPRFASKAGRYLYTLGGLHKEVAAMNYRCEVHSVEGFVQQLAVAYVPRGYWFYVTGKVPPGKDPGAVDRKLIEKYGLDVSKWARVRRKKAGFANVQYLRFEDFFVLLATEGESRFYEEEAKVICDVREVPIRFGGYAVSYRGGHAHTQIDQGVFNDLKAYFVSLAVQRSKATLEQAFSRLEFEPYAPIRSQLLTILRAVNKERSATGFAPLSKSCLRMRRRIVRPFDDPAEDERSGRAKLAA
jgi:hypothetical protein